MPPAPLFTPFRALGYITDDELFVVQRRGKETFVTVSVGRAWQVRVPHPRGVTGMEASPADPLLPVHGHAGVQLCQANAGAGGAPGEAPWAGSVRSRSRAVTLTPRDRLLMLMR